MIVLTGISHRNHDIDLTTSIFNQFMREEPIWWVAMVSKAENFSLCDLLRIRAVRTDTSTVWDIPLKHPFEYQGKWWDLGSPLCRSFSATPQPRWYSHDDKYRCIPLTKLVVWFSIYLLRSRLLVVTKLTWYNALADLDADIIPCPCCVARRCKRRWIRVCCYLTKEALLYRIDGFQSVGLDFLHFVVQATKIEGFERTDKQSVT